jgi:hypothetical protein
VLAETTWWSMKLAITVATIVFSTKQTWTVEPRSDNGKPYDLNVVATHEIGHALGLAHSFDGTVMDPYYDARTRKIQADDKAGVRALYGIDTLPDTSGAAPDITEFLGGAALAWRTPGRSVNVQYSSDLRGWAETTTIGTGAAGGPSVTVFKDELVVAWATQKGLILAARSPDARVFTPLAIPKGITSDYRPALCVHDKRLVLAWTGQDDNSRLNVVTATGWDAWQPKVTNKYQKSRAAPALASFGGQLVIAWADTEDPPEINVMSTKDWGATWTPKTTIGEACNDGPGLHAEPGALTLTWADADAPHRIHLTTSVGGNRFPAVNDVEFHASSNYTPAFTVVGGVQTLAWTGRDPDSHLNVLTL